MIGRSERAEESSGEGGIARRSLRQFRRPLHLLIAYPQPETRPKAAFFAIRQAGHRAKDDVTFVRLLRNADAVILGKADLTEFANMLAMDMPSGYSSLGGQVKNPYAAALVGAQRQFDCLSGRPRWV